MDAPAKEQPKEQSKLIVSIGPHMHDTESTAKIMWTVSGALLPATLLSVYYFGMPAILVYLVCLVSSLLSEAAVQWMLKKPVTISDGSAFLTGLLLAMNLTQIFPCTSRRSGPLSPLSLPSTSSAASGSTSSIPRSSAGLLY